LVRRVFKATIHVEIGGGADRVISCVSNLTDSDS
jgi:hypothetical protein